MLFSHPGIELKKHLEYVKKIGLEVFNSKSGLNLGVSNIDLEKALEIMLYYHDIGKTTTYFQDYLRSQIDDGVKYTDGSDLKSHALISACIVAYLVSQNTTSKDKELLSAIAFIIIRKHHGDFDCLENMLALNLEYKNLEKQYQALQISEFDFMIPDFKTLRKFIDNLSWFENIKGMEHYFLLNFCFSILVYADKSIAVFNEEFKIENLSLPANLIDLYKSSNFQHDATELNRIRNEIYQKTEESLAQLDNHKILSVNVPTGSGKTLTVLNAAIKLINKEPSLKRIIYALPFTSIIDQTASIIENVFSTSNLNHEDYFLIHHHLSEVKIKLDEKYVEGDRAQLLIENWDKPLILTTFWQFFNSLLTNDNRQLRKFHNIANSIIVLDEVQTISYQYWPLLNSLLKDFVERFNCRIILLTATMPLIFTEEKNEILNLIPKEFRENYFKAFGRYRLSLINGLNDINQNELFRVAVEHIERAPQKQFLFVFNTVKSSRDFYKQIQDYFHNTETIYLSSAVLPLHRRDKIKQIKKSKTAKIVVSTQLIEAGVDIDLDVVYRDFSPLDSIVQTSGRCNRNNSKATGEVYIFSLKKENSSKRDCNYIYAPVALKPTDDLLKEFCSFKENELLTAIDMYCLKIKESMSNDKSTGIVNAVNNLNYPEIIKLFKLIEEQPANLVFLEIDDSASKVLNSFNQIGLIEDRWQRKDEFLKIRKEFMNYCISVRYNPNEINSEFEEAGGFKFIPCNLISSYYDYETGFHKPELLIF